MSLSRCCRQVGEVLFPSTDNYQQN